MRRNPQHVNEDCWYYEEPKGICVVLHGETRQGCLMATIPWKMIRGSLKRKDKKNTKRKPYKPRMTDNEKVVMAYRIPGFKFNGEECRT